MTPCTPGGPHGPVRLLVGILSDPGNPERRRGIRDTWLRWGVGRAVMSCFGLGRRLPGRTAEHLAALDAEATAEKDILWLPNVSDGCSGRWMSIAKAHAFWRAAAEMLPPDSNARYVVKADDDGFVHLPNVLADLRLLSCVTHLVYGRIAWCASSGFASSGPPLRGAPCAALHIASSHACAPWRAALAAGPRSTRRRCDNAVSIGTAAATATATVAQRQGSIRPSPSRSVRWSCSPLRWCARSPSRMRSRALFDAPKAHRKRWRTPC